MPPWKSYSEPMWWSVVWTITALNLPGQYRKEAIISKFFHFAVITIIPVPYFILTTNFANNRTYECIFSRPALFQLGRFITGELFATIYYLFFIFQNGDQIRNILSLSFLKLPHEVLKFNDTVCII